MTSRTDRGQHHGQQRNRLRTLTMLVAALTSVAACDGSADVGTEDPPGISQPAGQTDPVETALQAAAIRFGLDESAVEAGPPLALSSSGCTLVSVARVDVLDELGLGVTVLPDGSTVFGGTDESFGVVARACFVDQGLVPDADLAAKFALKMAAMPGPVVELTADSGPRVLERFGVEWAPPEVTAADDGFSVTFFVENPETSRVVQVTTTVSGDDAATVNNEIG